MKIIQFTAENIKKLRIVQIKPDGSMIQITGPNGSGKSSVLDAIYWALAGAGNVTSVPVRRGAERAVIRLQLGEITVTRTFTNTGTTSLVVESAEGARYPSPQRMLDEMLGALTFDPLEFSRMDAKKQLDTIKALVPLNVDVDEIDRENAALYAERTEINREGKRIAERAAILKGAIGEGDVPTEPVDIEALMSKLEEVSQHNADIRIESTARTNMAHQVTVVLDAIRVKKNLVSAIEKEIVELQNQADRLNGSIQQFPPLPEPMDADVVRREIGEAQALNARIATAKDYLAVTEQLMILRAGAQLKTDRMTRNSEAKARAIADAKMPVDGLGFGEGEILYNALPFAQASSAEQLRVSVAIAMAGNPKLRVMRIKDGSLLDESNLALLAEMAEAQDFQIWVEKITSDDPVAIVMSDGMVVGG